MFSHYIHILFKKLQFLRQILKRFFLIFFRKNKKIELLQLDYSDKHLFQNSIIIIKYRFRNAIYYKFGKHITTDNEIKLFNLEKIDIDLSLTVYGFFRKQDYILKLKPEKVLINQNFKTLFSNFNITLLRRNLPKKITTEFSMQIENIKVNLRDVKLDIKPLLKRHDSFNQTDFL